MNNFERGLDPKIAMEIGIDEVLKKAEIFFHRNAGGEGYFSHRKKGGTIPSFSFTPEELRIIAAYLDAHTECIKHEPAEKISDADGGPYNIDRFLRK